MFYYINKAILNTHLSVFIYQLYFTKFILTLLNDKDVRRHLYK